MTSLVCSNLAQALLLPPGFVIEHDGKPHYVSLINLAGEDLPPADSAGIAAAQPRLACGVVLFDIWVANRTFIDSEPKYDVKWDDIDDVASHLDNPENYPKNSEQGVSRCAAGF